MLGGVPGSLREASALLLLWLIVSGCSASANYSDKRYQAVRNRCRPKCLASPHNLQILYCKKDMNIAMPAINATQVTMQNEEENSDITISVYGQKKYDQQKLNTI